MAAKNLETIRGIVRFRGDFPLSTKFTNANVNTEIQAAWSELHEIIEESQEGWFDKSGTVSTVASQAYIALPSDCWKVKGVDILESGEYKELDQVGIGDRNRFGSATEQPSAYRLTERGIDMFPTPDAAYTLRVTYARMVTALDEVTTTEFFNSWEEFVIEGAILRLNKRERRPINEQMAVLYGPEGLKHRISASANQRRQQEPEYLQLREYIDGDEFY